MYAIKCRVHWGGRATDNGRMDCIAGDAGKTDRTEYTGCRCITEWVWNECRCAGVVHCIRTVTTSK